MNDAAREADLAWARNRPWYNRPDERWLRPFVLLLAVSTGMLLGPKIQLGTQLVCEEILGVEAVGGLVDGVFNVLPAPHERPPLSDACLQSPAVEAGYTSLALRITLAMGVTSVVTTGFWGGLSDRRGRTFILRAAALGLTVGDLIYIVLGVLPQSHVPLGKELLVVGSAVEGLLGGIATITAAHLAYISDVTTSGTRAGVFSYFTGLFFFGFALGPGLGGLVVKWFGSTMMPFYFAFAGHVLYLLFVAVLLPESRSPERMLKAQEEHSTAIAEFVAAQHSQSTATSYVRLLWSYAVLPFRPLALLAPRRARGDDRRHGANAHVRRSSDESNTPAVVPVALSFEAATSTETTATVVGTAASLSQHNDDGEGEEHVEASASHISVSHSSRNALDWNITLTAIAYFLECCCLGVLTPKMNYAMLKYKWDGVEIGYFLSYASLTRVACLILLIPLFVKWAHQPDRRTSLSHDGKERVRRAGDNAEDFADERQYLLDHDGRPMVDDDYGRTAAPQYGATLTSSSSPSRSNVGEGAGVNEEQQFEDNFRLDGQAEHVERLWAMRTLHLRQIHDSRFDRRLALGSLAIAATCYVLLTVTSNAGPIPFVVLSGLTSLGGATSAALSSLALALLHSDGDSGKFFAAWSVLSALSQTIIGPILFSTLFVRTVSFAPQSIFVLGVVLYVIAGLFVAMIRVRHPRSLPALPPRPHTPATLRAMRERAGATNAEQHGSGPMKSSSSRIRLRAPIPFQQSSASATTTA